jgi:PAS domain-containing protein
MQEDEEGSSQQQAEEEEDSHNTRSATDIATASANTSNMAVPAGQQRNNLRRQERNMREQQRSQRINQQIKELRSLLSENKVPFKPTKHSILTCVVEYVRYLQTQVAQLDNEQQLLTNAIQQATIHATSATEAAPYDQKKEQHAAALSSSSSSKLSEVDYRSVFHQCSAALAVVTLDGRFIECNSEFESMSGYTREELTGNNFTIFNLINSTEMASLFFALGQMLSLSSSNHVNKNDKQEDASPTYWCGNVTTPRRGPDVILQMSITLVP